jgi:hypothetical protein
MALVQENQQMPHVMESARMLGIDYNLSANAQLPLH